MSVYHEVQLEFVVDALDKLEPHAVVDRVRGIVVAAWVVATDLPEDDNDVAVVRLENSNYFLDVGEQVIFSSPDVEWGNVLRKISHAKNVNRELIVEIMKKV